MIYYNQENRLFRLNTEKSSYIITITEEGYLLHTYYGAKISDDALEHLQPLEKSQEFSPSIPGGVYTLNTLMQEYPVNGTGDFRISAIALCGKSGCFATCLQYVSHTIFDGKKPLAGLPASYDNGGECQTLEITMRDTLLGVDVILSYTVFPAYDAMARSVRIENKSPDTVEIERVMSGAFDFNRADFDFIHLHGAWAKERQVERFPLHNGYQEIASKRGSSSHNHSPFAALARQDAGEEQGDVYGFTLVYSGNFSMTCEVDAYGTSRLLCGINPVDFGWHLEAGESFTSPEVLSVYSPEGIGGMSRRFHKLIRNNVCRGKYKNIRRPILVNNWEGTYFDFDDDKLVAIAKDAAELGIEMFVMDDGWFGRRSDDTSSLGDWWVNTDKLKGGLKPLVDRVNALGLKFGIWFEPEMISPDSDLYRAHPDWCIHVKGRQGALGRNQLVLDMTREDVRENIYTQMCDVLSSANIAYVKWDFNRNITDAGSALLPPERQKEFFHRYMLGVYALLEKLLATFPDLLLEGCSGGGGRYDAGMLYYSPQIWTSDNTDAMDRCFIQWGTAHVFPASSMSAHVSAVPNHQTGRSVSFKTRGDVAMGGAFGYELDLNQLSEEERAMVKKQVADYNRYYAVVNWGDYYRLISPFDTQTCCAWEYVSEDRSEAIVTYVVLRSCKQVRHRVYPKGLDAAVLYMVEGDGIETPLRLHGDTIMQGGLPVTITADGTSTVIVIRKV